MTPKRSFVPPFPQAPAAVAQAAKEQCGDFAEDCFRVSGNSTQSSATEPPRFTAARPAPKGARGSGGKRNRFPPAALRRFRRAKAAPLPQNKPVAKQQPPETLRSRRLFIQSFQISSPSVLMNPLSSCAITSASEARMWPGVPQPFFEYRKWWMRLSCWRSSQHTWSMASSQAL